MAENQNGSINIDVTDQLKEEPEVQAYSVEEIGDIKETAPLPPSTNEPASNLSQMNYAELTANKMKLEKTLKSITEAKSLIEEYKEMGRTIHALEQTMVETSEDTGADLKETVDMGLGSFEKNVRKFDENYDRILNETKESLKNIEDEINKRYRDVKKTTSFIVDQMYEVIGKRMKPLQEKREESEDVIEKLRIDEKLRLLNTINDALDDRDLMEFWLKRYSDPAVVRGIWRKVKKDFRESLNQSMRYLKRFFKSKDLIVFYHFLGITYVYPGAMYGIACIFYDLARFMRFERDTRKDWYARGLIMNALDYVSGLYDYHPDQQSYVPEHFLQIILKFRDVILPENSSDTENRKFIAELVKKYPKELNEYYAYVERVRTASTNDAAKELSETEATSI